MTTLETEGYRKERDRLEIRKIALVGISNAFKSSSREMPVELDNSLSVKPKAPYSTVLASNRGKILDRLNILVFRKMQVVSQICKTNSFFILMESATH